MSTSADRKLVGNYQMFYRYWDAPCDDVVVFIHGIPTNSHLWDQVIPYLQGKYKIIAVDMIGYGKSDRAPYTELTLPKQAEYMIQLLSQLGIEKAHFVGHDLGGGIVQIIAVHYPQHVKSLVIADGVCFSNWPLPKVVSIRWPTAFEFEPTPLFIERMLREGVYNPQVLTPKIIKYFTAPFSGPDGPQQLQQASFALDHRQTERLVPYLKNIQFPTTLLWGQHDRYLVPYWAQALHQTLPSSRLKILPKCSHYSMLDSPSLFSNELLEHLDMAP
ncbi:pimeloyl-ACP methyl ester carboxylesterase [Melghiribacillus thermohalophilus]|uniref:Pimeloyl-ACP methyl ester carboxylesterase n=1 Tax=Melghiribacillus thermohalophilus TaxID=1324956 RepID=A0A4R3N1K2_9BACI|nr:alpha/beta hydrolase [Melghiribacillus thermohalophilus]TCT20943.1 pimeloyl-ACP methyl ester carboxylesterase [Melghiribacillus thermohalophilus]